MDFPFVEGFDANIRLTALRGSCKAEATVIFATGDRKIDSRLWGTKSGSACEG